MAKKITGSRKSSKKGPSGQRKISNSVLIAIGLVVAVPIIIAFGTLFGIAPILIGSEGTGYCYFNLFDSENQTLIDGQVALTNFETGELVGIYNTGDTIFVSQSVLATIYSVDLEPGDSRTFLPFTIVPNVEGTADNPQSNTIITYFLRDTSEIFARIKELDGSPITYTDIENSPNSATIISADVEHELVIDINVTTTIENSVYGASSYVPELFLPTESANEEITGFGLWLYIDEEIVIDDVLVNGYSTSAFYISSGDYSIILLEPVYQEGLADQTITFEAKETPNKIEIFQGFLDDYSTTKIDAYEYVP